MSRVLKFRAWDTVTKQWLAEGFHLIGETTCFDIIGQKLKPNPAKPDEPKLIRYNDVIVTQFTGLLDRHGKEIYEGDIVAGNYGEQSAKDETLERITGRVNFERGGFVVDFFPITTRQLYDLNGNHAFYWRNSGANQDWYYRIEAVEVIGNRYEHPHLLDEAGR